MVGRSFILVIAFVAFIHAYPVQETDPELFGGYFEGDMELDDYQRSALNDPRGRNGLLDQKYNWLNNIVYYELSDVFDEDHVNHILKGLDYLESVSCLRFLPRTATTKDYVLVTGEDSGCHSKVGRRGGLQTLNYQIYPLEAGCFRIGTIVHEFLHALGFYHQQSSYDRDDYVTIVEENILDGKAHNFNKYKTTVVSDYGVPYDYESVMHYSSLAFSNNGEMTIVPNDPNANLGQRLKLSDADILKLNHKYNCPVLAQ